MRRIFKIDNRNRTNKEVRKFERDGTKWKAHEKYQNESVCCLDHTNLRWTLYWQTKQNKIKLKIQTSPFVTLWTLERINDHGIDFVLIHARIGKDFIRMDGEIHTVYSLRCCCCKWEREWGKIQSKIFDFIYVENQKKLRLLFISRPTPWIWEKIGRNFENSRKFNTLYLMRWEKNVDWKKLDVKKNVYEIENLTSTHWNEMKPTTNVPWYMRFAWRTSTALISSSSFFFFSFPRQNARGFFTIHKIKFKFTITLWFSVGEPMLWLFFT